MKMKFVLETSLKNDENFQAVLRQNYIKCWLPFYKVLFLNLIIPYN